jgi:hypothetical protein
VNTEFEDLRTWKQLLGNDYGRHSRVRRICAFCSELQSVELALALRCERT